MKQIGFILTAFLIFMATEAYASGPETCDSVSIGPDDFYFIQGGDSTLLLQMSYIGSETVPYPVLQVQMDDTSYLVVDGFHVQTTLASDLLTFYVRYKQTVPSNYSIGGKLRITNPNLSPPLDCAARLTIHVNSTSSVNDLEEPPFEVFPIPADRELVIRSTDSRPQPYQIYNSIGCTVRSGTCSGTTTISLTGLPAGGYFVVHPSGWQQMILVAPR